MLFVRRRELKKGLLRRLVVGREITPLHLVSLDRYSLYLAAAFDKICCFVFFFLLSTQHTRTDIYTIALFSGTFLSFTVFLRAFQCNDPPGAIQYKNEQYKNSVITKINISHIPSRHGLPAPVAKLPNCSRGCGARCANAARRVCLEWIGTACLSVSPAASAARPAEPRPARRGSDPGGRLCRWAECSC